MSEKSGNLLSLGELHNGEKGTIVSITTGGDLGKRIREMGLIIGTEIEVVGHAPLQDPLAVRVKGVTLSLRKNEASYIVVEKEELSQEGRATCEKKSV